MNKKVYIANWKMNLDVAQSVALAREFAKQGIGELAEEKGARVFIATSTLAAREVITAVADSGILVSAQDCSTVNGAGAFTGEVSAAQLASSDLRAVLVGHSERRHLLGETDADVNTKLKNVIESKLTACLCIGETSEQRSANETEKVIEMQLDLALAGLTADQLAQYLVIGYEPVWAISTFPNAKIAEVADIAAAHKLIRELLVKKLGAEVGQSIPVLYGGSVKPENVNDLVNIADVDGYLVGGASLDAAKFRAIVEA